MQELKEKAAYLRGLMEGANFSQDEKEKMVWESLIDFCDEVAEEMGQLDDSQNEFAEYIEAIDEDLSSLEKYFYNNEEHDDDTEVIFSKDGNQAIMEMSCPHCSQDIYFEDEPGNYEVVCPECGKIVWSSAKEETPNHRTDVI